MPTFDVGSHRLIGAMIYRALPPTLRLASTGFLPARSTSVHREVTCRPQWLSSSPSQGSKVGEHLELD